MAIEVKKPTAFNDISIIWSNETNAYDTITAGDETTYTDTAAVGDFAPAIEFTTWATKGETYTATVLKLKWDCLVAQTDDTWGIEYTKDGSNWYDLLVMGNNQSTVITTAEIALDSNQDLTLVGVRVNTDQLKGADGHTIRIYDIWTEGTYEAAPLPKLHYRKSDATTDITLYDAENGTWNDSLRLRAGGAIIYAQLDSNTSHANASDLRIRVGGTTYAVLTASGIPS